MIQYALGSTTPTSHSSMENSTMARSVDVVSPSFVTQELWKLPLLSTNPPSKTLLKS